MKENFPHWQYWVVEQDATPTQNFVAYDPLVKHIFLFNDQTFNKAWSLNVAIKKNPSPWIIIIDADILVSPQVLSKGMALLQNGKVDSVDFFQTYLWCGPHISQDIKSTKLRALLSADYFKVSQLLSFYQDGTHWREDSPYFGGAHALSREAFESVGGMEEDYEGWGGEDFAMGFKLRRLKKTLRLSSFAFHLYHPQAMGAQYKGTLKEANYFKYRSFKHRLKKKSELLKYVIQKKSRENYLGDIHRYRPHHKC